MTRPRGLNRRLVLGAVSVAVLAVVVASAVPVTAAEPRAVNTIGASGLANSTETWEATAVDYDRDGDQDVWIGYHDQGGKLWRNDGAGFYTRVAPNAWPMLSPEGLVVDRHYCDWADVDRNGRPDAYCGTGRSEDNLVKNGMDNELWLQAGNGSFTDVGTAWAVGEVCGRSHYVTFVRANGDAFPDIFVGNAPPRTDDDDPCDDPANGLPNESSKLFLNDAGAGFHLATGWGITGNGGVRCAETADFSGDGRDDLLVCAQPTIRLYRHNAGSGFTDVAANNHLGGAVNDAAFADLDRDGDVDLVTCVGRTISYRLNSAGQFGPAVLIATVPSGGSVRSFAAGDADGDGDLDLYAMVSNLTAGTNPADRLLLNNALSFSAVAVPAAGGIGDAVTALDGNNNGRAEFLVLNGVEVNGPIQRIVLR